jgi:hypothetical protein
MNLIQKFPLRARMAPASLAHHRHFLTMNRVSPDRGIDFTRRLTKTP